MVVVHARQAGVNARRAEVNARRAGVNAKKGAGSVRPENVEPKRAAATVANVER
jgi:hypothetical protein